MNSKRQQRRWGTTEYSAMQQEQHRQRLVQGALQRSGTEERKALKQLAVHDYSETRSAGGAGAYVVTARAKGKTDRDSCRYFAAKNRTPR